MEEEEEEQSPRMTASAAAVLFAGVLLVGAISYNALWRQALSADGTEEPVAEHMGRGSARVVVDLDQPQPNTVTLRYDPIVESVQRELAAAGMYDGAIDGVSGKRTQLAIITYQRVNQLKPTGMASQELIDHIQLTRQFTAASDTTASLPGDLSPAAIKSVQTRLAELGYDPGAVDGKFGATTQIAVRRFQKDRGLTPTGQLSEEVIAALSRNNL